MLTVPIAPMSSGVLHRRTAGGLSRVLSLPLAAHAAALAIALVCLMPVVGVTGSFSADEGAALAEVHSVVTHGTWTVAGPFPSVDPHGGAYLFEGADVGARGAAPFAKHSMYIRLLAVADRVAGQGGIIGLGLLGTVMAALGAALLARRLDPRLAVPVFWAVGIGSPLLFDGYLVIAHSLGAALAVGATLAALRTFETGRWRFVACMGAALTAAVVLRNEALLFALALAAGAAVPALRDRRTVVVSLPVVAVLAGATAHHLDGRLTRSIVGMPRPSFVPPSGTGGGKGLVASFHGFVTTWLAPGYGGRPTMAAVLAATGFLIIAAALVRVTGDRRAAAVAACVAAAVAAATAAFLLPPGPVPGLLLAFPLLAVGCCLLRRSHLRGRAAGLMFITSVVFAVAVIATQYAHGGSGEWGGRYFAIGLPLVSPVLALAARDQMGRRTPMVARSLLTGLIVVSVALAGISIHTLRSSHRSADRLVALVGRATAVAGPAGDGGHPVVIGTRALEPRLAWRTAERDRWLLIQQADLASYAWRLRSVGITAAVLITDTDSGGMAADGAALAAAYRIRAIVGSSVGGSYRALILEAR